MNRTLNPKSWAKPRGYANGIAARGTFVFVAGQIGWNGATAAFETDDFVGQAKQALANIVAVLGGGRRQARAHRPPHLVRDRQAGIHGRRCRPWASAYREVIGRHYPTMALVEVRALVEDRARVEIEATAVIPD